MNRADRRAEARERANRYRRAMQGWWELRPSRWRVLAYALWLMRRPRWEVEE